MVCPPGQTGVLVTGYLGTYLRGGPYVGVDCPCGMHFCFDLLPRCLLQRVVCHECGRRIQLSSVVSLFVHVDSESPTVTGEVPNG